MALMSFLNLPEEVRKQIYSNLFGYHRTELQIEVTDTGPMAFRLHSPRSAQILRTCGTIFVEASPILMDQTTMVAPRQSPVPLAFGREYRSIYNWRSEIFTLRFLHLELHIQPELLCVGKDIIHKEYLGMLKSLRLISSSILWTGHFEAEESYLTGMYPVVHGQAKEFMLSYLARSRNFTHLADESVVGRQICFHLSIANIIKRSRSIQR